MTMQDRFPNLFGETVWEWGPARVKFDLLDSPPPDHLIANVNIAPHVGERWLVLRLYNGNWEIPGGTLEPGETYADAIRRELEEEAGARLVSYALLGAWRCHSLAPQPYRPHLPHPDFYRLVVCGEVELIANPTNPQDGEQVARVELASLDEAAARFRSINRPDLAELYQLAAVMVSGK